MIDSMLWEVLLLLLLLLLFFTLLWLLFFVVAARPMEWVAGDMLYAGGLHRFFSPFLPSFLPSFPLFVVIDRADDDGWRDRERLHVRVVTSFLIPR